LQGIPKTHSKSISQLNIVELEIKDTTDTDRSASYLEIHLEIDSEGRLRTELNDKRDDFNFPIVGLRLLLLLLSFL
jgi:hypothetical protein